MLFIPKPGFGDELQRQEASADGALVKAAEAARGEAERIGNRIMPRNRSRSFEVESDDDGVRLVNTDYGAAIDEWGSAKSVAYAPLRNGCRAAGLELREQQQ